jgi:hypothetical protein
VDTRQQRIARNEALFREVNERIEQVNRSLGSETDADFICECGDEDCTKPVTLTLAEYEKARSDPTYFVVAPGHQAPDVEQTIARTERYAIVEKQPPAAARIAVEEDPRS